MKKTLIAILAVASLFVGCKKDPVLVGSITLSQTTASVIEGDQLKITATVAPDNAENKELTWASDNTGVATVDASGTVTGVKEGTAKITASSTDGSNVKATCNVTVTKKVIPVTKIDLSLTELKLKKGETATLQVQVTPADATYQTVKFESSDPNVASVDDNGVVTAKAKGTANITAKATDDSGVKSAACVVTVTEPKTMFLDVPYAVLRSGCKTVTIHGYYGNIDEVKKNWKNREEVEGATWKSSNEGVVTVSSKGVLSVVAPGKATVSLTDADGSSASCEVEVLAPTVKPAEMLRGLKVADCAPTIPAEQSADWAWYTKRSTLSLADGYVAGTKCIANTNVGDYRLFQVLLDKPIDASKIANPALFFRFYIDDVTKLTYEQGGEIELKSAGDADAEELTWSFPEVFKNNKFTLQNGWNTIVLPFDAVTSKIGEIRLDKINFFRMYENPGTKILGGNVRIDQLQIVNWKSFDACENFDMWYDGNGIPQRQWVYDTAAGMHMEGAGAMGVNNYFWQGADSFRLKLWPGLEYAMPFTMDETNATFKCWLYIDKPEFLKAQQVQFELSSSSSVNDVFDFVLIAGTYDFKQGWNEISLPFSAARKVGAATVNKLNWLRVILQFNAEGLAPEVINLRIDDIRIDK